MSLLMPKKGGGNYELVPAGNHVGTCYRVIDLGTHVEQFPGNEPKRVHKVMIGWELTDEKMSDGRPFVTAQEYNLSSHEKSKFRKHLESWRGRAFTEEELGTFDIARLLRVPCMVDIVHKASSQGDKTYANVSTISSLPKALKDKVSPLVNEVLQLDLSNFDRAVYDKLPDWIKEKIAKSPEYQELMGDPRQDDQSREEYGVEGGPDAPF
jgi:hypothetical protein